MIELYYKTRLFTFLFNYPYDQLLDIQLGGCLKSGIDVILPNKVIGGFPDILGDKYEKTVQFNNGAIMKFWNANKYYAWVNSGYIIFADKTQYVWSGSRPSVKNMFLLKQALKNYQPPIIIETNPFNL